MVNIPARVIWCPFCARGIDPLLPDTHLQMIPGEQEYCTGCGALIGLEYTHGQQILKVTASIDVEKVHMVQPKKSVD